MIKILCVDDEPGICDILKKIFSPMGFTVLIATNGSDALTIVKREKPKIIFLDIRMLGMSGLEVLKEIKKLDASTKVIMVTVLDEEKTKKEAITLGADEFITKPFTTDYLEEVLRKEINQIFEEEKQARIPNILIVDDEEDVRERLGNLISRKIICTVEKASSGEDALLKLKSKTFDLVVLDIKMPGLSGIDVMKEALKFTPQTKFLAISGYDSHEIAEQALKAGAVDFLPKPQSQEAIQIKLKEILTKIEKYHAKRL